MSWILAIDPGSTQSAYVFMDRDTYRPILFGKDNNDYVLDRVKYTSDGADLAIEMIASYGMPVGAEVFDTVLWIGRFLEASRAKSKKLIYRRDEKLNLCGTSKANDATIRQALIDRFAPGVRNCGKGTKKQPGWFYKFASDMWQAYAVGVTYLDMIKGEANEP